MKRLRIFLSDLSRLWQQLKPFVKTLAIFGSASLIIALILDCCWYSYCFGDEGGTDPPSTLRELYFFGLGLMTFGVGVVGFLFTIGNALLYTKNELLARDLRSMEKNLREARVELNEAITETETLREEVKRLSLSNEATKQLDNLRRKLTGELTGHSDHMALLESKGSPFISCMTFFVQSITDYLQLRDFVDIVMMADCAAPINSLYAIQNVQGEDHKKIAARMIDICLPFIEEDSPLYNQLRGIRVQLPDEDMA